MNLSNQILENLYLYDLGENFEITENIKLIKSTENRHFEIEVKKFKTLDYLNKLDIISMIDIFEGLNLKNLRDLIEISSEETYVQGQVVIKKGTLGFKWYIILKGSARISFENQIYEDRDIFVGDYFGEGALSQIVGRRTATVQATSDLKVLTLEKQDFWFAFGSGPESMGTKILDKQNRLYISRRDKAFSYMDKNKFFCDFKQSQQRQIQMILRTSTVKRGDVIWKVGEMAEFALIIKQGILKFYGCPEADYGILFKEGSFIGDMRALLEETENTTGIKAEADCELFLINRLDLILFFQRNPGIFLQFGNVKYIL